jgi:Holliday junction resolvase RusA-like endonuclease
MFTPDAATIARQEQAIDDAINGMVDPKRDPAFTFDCFVPGRPMAKGSPQPKTRRGHTIMIDRPAVMQWVATVAAHAYLQRHRRENVGDKSFPYEAPLELKALFVFPRPRSGMMTVGLPIICVGPNAVGDLDKLVRAVGDALSPGTVTIDHQKLAKAAVIEDDRLITDFGKVLKRFTDQVPGSQPGCYLKVCRASEESVDLSEFV